MNSNTHEDEVLESAIDLNQNEPGFDLSRDLILFSFWYRLFCKLNKKIAKSKQKKDFSCKIFAWKAHSDWEQ